MSGYIRNLKATAKIDGVEHAFEIRAMLYAESVLIYEAGEAIADDTPAGKQRKRRAIRQKALDLLPSAILSVTPPVPDAAGAPVTPEELCRAHYFFKAMLGVSDNWIIESQPADPKSPAESSDGGSTASPSTTQTPAAAA